MFVVGITGLTNVNFGKYLACNKHCIIVNFDFVAKYINFVKNVISWEGFSEERDYILFAVILNQTITFIDLASFHSKPKHHW